MVTKIFVFSLQQFATCQTKQAAREQAQFESQILNLAHFRKIMNVKYKMQKLKM